MLTIQNIQDKVNLGKAYYIQEMNKRLALMKMGCGDTKDLRPLKRLIRALTFQIQAELITADTLSLYNCLVRILAAFSGSYVLDPEVVIPGQTVITITQVVGYNEGKIPFSVDEANPTIVLNNYNTNPLLYALYGNNPDLALYDDQGNPFVGDQQTPPNITYDTDNFTGNIVSISWSYPPIPGITTTGYIRIAGKAPNSSGTGSGGGGGSTPIPPITFTQADLREDGVGTGNWYLPLGAIGAHVPVIVTTNGIGLAQGYNNNYTPARYYGFANNDAQVIKVTVI